MKFRRLRDGILMAVIVIAVFAILLSQIYLSVHGSENTRDAVLYTCKESISFTGVFVRDETVIYSQHVGEGVLNYSVEDGSKLSKNSSVAKIYDSYLQIYNRYRIERLEKELDNLKRAQDPGTTDYAQPEFINTQIGDSYKNLLLNLAGGNLPDVYDESLEMLKLMNIYNIATKAEYGYDARVQLLENEIGNLGAALKDPIATVTSNGTGYFTSEVDGYENELTTENIPNMTVDDIKNIIAHPDRKTKSYKNAVGKVFSDYEWKMVGVIDVANRYFVHEDLTFSIDSSENTHTVTVESITPTGNGNEAIIVISCDELDSELARTRVADVELTFVEKTGIWAPRDAIRFSNGVKGVYVMVGEQTKFKKLDVIYEGDDYVLSSNTSDSEYLNLYDRIIIDPIAAPDIGGIETVSTEPPEEEKPPESLTSVSGTDEAASTSAPDGGEEPVTTAPSVTN